jgi:hypothetical protein
MIKMAVALVVGLLAGTIAFAIPALAVCNLPNPVYTGDTRKDCPVCVSTCRRPDWQTDPNTAARKAACVKNNRCTAQQVQK